MVEPNFVKNNSITSDLLITTTLGISVHVGRVTHNVLVGSLSELACFQHLFGMYSVNGIQSSFARVTNI